MVAAIAIHMHSISSSASYHCPWTIAEYQIYCNLRRPTLHSSSSTIREQNRMMKAVCRTARSLSRPCCRTARLLGPVASLRTMTREKMAMPAARCLSTNRVAFPDQRSSAKDMSTLLTPAGLPNEVRDLVIAFYAASDRRDVNAYVDFFVEDCDFVMGLKAAEGRDAVRTARGLVWNGVASRKHTPRNLYAFADNDFMLYGEVLYGLENGNAVSIDFAARILLRKGEDALKIKRYQVWFDTSKLVEAMK